MIVHTNEGPKEGTIIEHILDTPEPTFKVILIDGGVLHCRTTITHIVRYYNNAGQESYFVGTFFSVAKG